MNKRYSISVSEDLELLLKQVKEEYFADVSMSKMLAELIVIGLNALEKERANEQCVI